MAIKKQEFYEGAALYLLARTSSIRSIRYQAPFFLLNENLLIYLKHCAKSRSPWGFTFTKDEQDLLRMESTRLRIIIGLVCGSDGVAALTYEAFARVAGPSESAVRIACQRRYNEHYSVKGPGANLDRKIAPSTWLRILAQ